MANFNQTLNPTPFGLYDSDVAFQRDANSMVVYVKRKLGEDFLSVELTKKENCYVTFQGENSCEQELQELLKYLQADKRIYFYERTRNILTLLNESIEIYETAVNDDVRSILNIFRKQYYAMIKEFSVYKNNNCDSDLND